MPKPLVCLAAKGVIRDATDNQISVFGILETLQPEGFPVVLQNAAALAIFQKEVEDPDSIDITFDMLNNTHRLGPTLPLQINFKRSRIHRNIVNLAGLLIKEPGVLSFRFAQGETVLASYEVRVLEAPAHVAEARPKEPGADQETN